MAEEASQPLIIFATYAAQPTLSEDDELFARALERRGARVRAMPWDDKSFAWSSADIVVIRSTWDYHHRLADYLAWVERVSATTTLHNDARVVKWNSHKTYLGELAREGVPVIHTVFASAGADLDLEAVKRVHGWHDVVVKPAVSNAAHETRRFASGAHGDAQAHLDRLLPVRDVMIQPHLSELAEQGELSLLFARGTFTHAVRRRSALVNGHPMPKSASAEAPARALECAERVLTGAQALTGVTPNDYLYGRVDLAPSGADFLLLELELIEPSLFLLHAPAAAESYAEALLSS
jgi:hypothetical protein